MSTNIIIIIENYKVTLKLKMLGCSKPTKDVDIHNTPIISLIVYLSIYLQLGCALTCPTAKFQKIFS